VRKKYSEEFLEKEVKTLHELKKAGIDCVSCSTEEDIIKPLVKLFQQR
jgi:hypothetical protein